MRLNKRQKIFIIPLFSIIVISIIFLKLQGSPQPNILLITIDALRPDHLGCYGYKRNTSPNIDKLAEEGVKFTQAISQGSQTIPSLPSLMTSLYPSKHGIETIQQIYSISHPVLAQILKKNGYYTGAIVAHPGVYHWGLYKGFDSVEFGFDNKANILNQKAINWLYENKDKKFFLWLHYFDPHDPYIPPAPYNKKYLYDNLYKQDRNILIDDNENVHISNGNKYVEIGTGAFLSVKETGITEVDYYIAQYDGEINFTDENIGILLETIEELGLDKKTIIVLTADHGEHMDEHKKYFLHDHSLYDELIKVPLIIKLDRLIPDNKVINQQVRLIDIMPTILDILNIKESKQIEGNSLLPLILGKDNFPELFAFSETFSKTGKRKSIRTSEWKLIYDYEENEYELYNLKKDPKELTNLIELEKEKFQFLKQKLDNYMKQTLQSSVEPSKFLDKDLKEKLKSLGYVQ